MAMTSCEEFLSEMDVCAFADPDAEICKRFRAHLSTCDSCSKELLETQNALNFLPLGLPQAPLRRELKQKILGQIAAEARPNAGLFNFDALDWKPSDIPGLRFHWLRRDETGTTAALVRISPGHFFPNHRHIGPEDSLVLQGGFRDNRGQYERGDYVHYEAGSVQTGLQALDDEECILFVVNQQGIEFQE